VDALNELFTSGVIDVLGDLVVIFAIIGMMFWLDWKLAVASLIAVPLLFAATNWFRKHARRGFRPGANTKREIERLPAGIHIGCSNSSVDECRSES
jgi:ABC-type bacteriocin/lantibiotic exporter with double-glycine peptidase domain